MFHVTENFPAGGPITQVPTSWFNKVAHFLNNLIGDGATVDKSDPPVIRVDADAIAKKLSGTGTPVDGKDSPNVLDTNGASWTWQAGGDNGLELDCYCRIAPQQSGSAYSVFQRVRMTFSKSGLLVSAELLADRIRLQSRNA